MSRVTTRVATWPAAVLLATASIALTVFPLGKAPASAATDSVLPAGFQEETMFAGYELDNATAVEFSADGRVFIAEQSGLIKIFEDLDDPSPTTFSGLLNSVHAYWDRGLLGMALHPNFPAAPYVYVLYTYDFDPDPDFDDPQPPRWGTPGSTSDGCPDPVDDGCVVIGRLSRLQVGDSGIVSGSESPLVTDWCQQFPSHTVGTVAFGPDGALYAGGGDGANFDFVDYGQFGDPLNPCDDPPTGRGGDQSLDVPSAEGGALRSQDLRTTGDPDDPVGLDGTIIRLDPGTGEGMPDNPLATDPDPNARRIVSHGFRNPFRFTFRPGTNELWVGDVGWRDVEEINRIPSPASAVTNHGWPCYEGSSRQDGYDATDFNLCEDLYQDGQATPYYDYSHGEEIATGDDCREDTGSSLSGMAFYEGGDYPPMYEDALFFSDYSRGCIWVMQAGAGGVPDPSTVAPFVEEAANPVEIEIGPGGDLFYVDIGEGGGTFAGSLRRIEFTGHAPSAVATADPTQGPAPLSVEFDGTASSDPDGDEGLTYGWDLDGDGSFDDDTRPVFTYEYPAGSYTARLRVTDPSGLFDTSDPIIISSGNTSPTSVIETPVAGTRWVVGDEIAFQGYATDPQQGTLPESALRWNLTQVHGGHDHGVQTWTGVDGGTLKAPSHEYPSHLELTLTATDAGGLTHSQTVRLDPETVDLTFGSDPNGLELTVGPTGETTSFTRTVIVGSKNTITAPSPQTSSSSTWEWVSWSDGGAASHEIIAPSADTTYTAVFQAATAAPNAAPSPSIDTPSPTTTWAVGEPVAFSGHATDLQEGELPASSLAWRLILHDCGSCPAQTIQTWPGAKDGSFTPPPAGSDAYLELELSATDSQGSAGSTTRRLDPQLVRVAVATKPAGLNARVASAPQEVAAARSVIAGTEVKVRAPKRQRAEGMKFRFRGWSDGGSRIHDVVVGPGTPMLVAKYRCVPGPGESRKDCRRAIADLKANGRQPS